jgi:hypothetical protein
VNSFQEVVAGDTDVRFVVTLREPGKARVRLEVVDAAGTPVDIGSGMMRVPVLSSATALSAASFDEGRDTGVGLAMTGRSVTLRSGDAAGDGSKPAGSLPQSWLENIRPGDWWLVLKAPDLGPALVPLHVDAADRELRARIVLPKPGSLRVGVDFGDAAPPPETMVIVGGLPGAPWRSRIWLDDLHVGGYARRSDDGLWALDGIMPGRYTITLYAGHLCSEVLTVDVPSGGVARASLTARPGGVVEWTPVVPRNHEAEFAFAVGDGEFEVVTEQVGFGRPLGIPLPSFPPGRLRWRVRVAQQGVLASEGRRIATYSGEVTVVAGRNVTLPEGPFEPAR